MTTLASYDIARRITSRFRKLTSGYTSGSFSNDLGTAFVNFTASDGRLYRAYVAMAADTFARPIGFDHITRSEEHTSELQSLMRISYAVFCLKKKKYIQQHLEHTTII